MRLNTIALAVGVGLVTGCTSQGPLVSSSATVEKDNNETANVVFKPEPLADKVSEVSGKAAQNVTLREDSVAPEDLWQRLADGMQLQGHRHPGIGPHLEWYSSHQDYIDRVFERAQRYLHFITSEVETRNMPLELALLPVVESAFDPFAYSNSHAAGLWQFVPGTARRFGLERNWWYEGRRDVVASTNAALDYLSYLHELFDGDWLLALAAYNSGEGTVRRAIRRNQKAGKATDFWSLRLPRETRSYVPQLLAICRIVKDPDAWGVELPDLANTPYFDRVALKAQIDLSKAAEIAGIEPNEIYLLNPAYNRLTTAPGENRELLLPSGNIGKFRDVLANLPQDQWVVNREYIVRPGDTLSRIASKNKMSISALRTENLLKSDLIRVGQVLKIPGGANAAPSASRQAGYYLVRGGDSLWEIARAHNIRVNDILAWNNLSPQDLIHPGQELQVSSERPMTKTRKLSYRVKRGDSLARIANRFNVKIKDIVSWNSINPSHYLQPGQKLKLFIDVRSI